MMVIPISSWSDFSRVCLQIVRVADVRGIRYDHAPRAFLLVYLFHYVSFASVLEVCNSHHCPNSEQVIVWTVRLKDSQQAVPTAHVTNVLNSTWLSGIPI